jgi:hypothetical protein
MEIKHLIWFLFLVSVFTAKAQEKFSADVSLKTEPTEKINFNETNIGISLSKKIDAKNEIRNTTEYTNLKIKYELGRYDNFENLNQFNRFQNKLEILHEVSNTAKWNLSIIPAINFQQNLGISDVTILGSFQFSQKLNSNTGINIGVARSAIFGSAKFIPVLSVFSKINNETNILIGFPDSKISYSNNERNMFSLSNSFNGNFYNLGNSVNSLDTATKISTSQITTAIEYERNVTKNWFMIFKAGYDSDKKYNLMDENNHKVYDFNTGNGYILSIGIKYKQ